MPRYVFVIVAAAFVALGVAGGSQASTQRYDDYVEDVLDAPDIGAVNLVTNDNEAITIGMQIHDRSAFGGTDAYSIALDTDSNAATGGGADYRVAGADYVIDLSDVASRLMIWNGTSYVLVTPRPLLPTVWIDGYGPVVQIPRAALGDPQSFDVVLRTASGLDVDLAPDVGSWAYTVRPLELAAGRGRRGPRAGGKAPHSGDAGHLAATSPARSTRARSRAAPRSAARGWTDEDDSSATSSPAPGAPERRKGQARQR